MRGLRFLAIFWVVVLANQASSQTPISREIPNDVVVMADMSFVRYGDLILELDIYRPVGREDKLPVVILIQGGGAANGEKETFGAIAAKFAQFGLAAVSIDYRGYNQALFPATITDVQAAITWLVGQQDNLMLDVENIGVFGGSYGGLIALYAGLSSSNSERWESKRDIDAIVGFSAMSDLVNLESGLRFGERYLGVSRAQSPQYWEEASPINFVGENSPPLLLVASDADTTVPQTQSLAMAREYEQQGADVELLILSGAHHAFWNYTQWFDETAKLAAMFFVQNLQN